MIKLFRVPISEETDLSVVTDTLRSGYIAEGARVAQLEGIVSRFLVNPNVALVNSGTSALTLALIAAGIKPGDAVVTTPMTCSATNLAIINVGAIPVFADIDHKTGNLLPASVEETIEKAKAAKLKVKAVMVVDWAGWPAPLAELRDICDAHKLSLIEDAAHAFGAYYRGARVGSGQFADFTCFSFQAIKHFTTGDGGAVACAREEDCERIKKLRWFGIDRNAPAEDTRIDLDIEEPGYKMHMNDVAAAIGMAQCNNDLKGVPVVRNAAAQYLFNAKQLSYKLTNCIWKPQLEEKESVSAAWVYTIKVKTRTDAEELQRWLAMGDIQSSKVHRDNLQYSVFRDVLGMNRPGLKLFYDNMLCLPCHEDLTLDQISYIARRVNEFCQLKGYCNG